MRDIIEALDGQDLGVGDTAVMKAANLLSIQLGDLEYAPDFGVDLRYFLASDFQIQMESFKAHIVEKLVQNQISVSEVLEVIETFYQKFTFKVGDANTDAKGLIL